MSALEVFWLAELTKVIKKYCLIPPSFLPIFFLFPRLRLAEPFRLSRKLHLWGSKKRLCALKAMVSVIDFLIFHV